MTKANLPTGRLIALHGQAGCGKSTISDHLVATRGYQVRSFAEPIRQMLIAMGVDPKYFTRALKGVPIPEFGHKSARYLMQTLGTEWGREKVRDSLWLDIMYRSSGFQSYLSGGNLVIDDLRFLNEFEFLAGNKALMVKIVRPGLPPPDGGVAGHASESGIPDNSFHYFLCNDTTVESLLSRTEQLLKVVTSR